MESFVTAKLLYVANMVRKTTNSSKDFIDAIKQDNKSPVVGILPLKELFNRSTVDKCSISDMAKQKTLYHKEQAFFSEIDRNFSSMQNRYNIYY